jgi:hypothetical protein
MDRAVVRKRDPRLISYSVPTHSFASCFDDGQCVFGPAMRGEDGTLTVADQSSSFGNAPVGLRRRYPDMVKSCSTEHCKYGVGENKLP